MILVISSKKSYVSKRLAQEAEKLKVLIKVVPANKASSVKVEACDCLYIRDPYFHSAPKYIPSIIALAKKFKKAGKRVVDLEIASGNLGKGKWVDYQRLMKANLRIPNTQILSRRSVPKTWPFILKWVYGFKGKNVFLIKNQKQFNEVFAKYSKEELLVQEFIPAQFEYKIITVGYKALPVILKFKIADYGFRINFEKYQVIKSSSASNVVRIAQKASKILGRELAKVDILEAKGKFYILEVNRFPGLDSFEKLTKYNAVKEFVGYLQK